MLNFVKHCTDSIADRQQSKEERMLQGTNHTAAQWFTLVQGTPQCPNKGRCIACQAGLEGRCTAKNVIYRLNCTICSESYIGETKRPVRERLLEHRRAALNRNGEHTMPLHTKIHQYPMSPLQPESSGELEIMSIGS